MPQHLASIASLYNVAVLHYMQYICTLLHAVLHNIDTVSMCVHVCVCVCVCMGGGGKCDCQYITDYSFSVLHWYNLLKHWTLVLLKY